MAQVIAAAYLARRAREPDDMGSTAEAFYRASSGFPFDIGDDPSFFSSQHHGGPITWGVCRPDARGLIRPDDCVAFFSAEREGTRFRYSFIAGLQVERLTSHVRIWSPGVDEAFSHYLNVLVRPNEQGWEHHEPGLHRRDWHRDWIWRMCVRKRMDRGRALEAGAAGQLAANLVANGVQFEAADTYVVFRRDNAVLAPRPLLVAEFVKGEQREVWATGDAVLRLKGHVFGPSPNRCLRTTNRQQPHRHVRRPIPDPGAWMRDVAVIVTEADHRPGSPTPA